MTRLDSLRASLEHERALKRVGQSEHWPWPYRCNEELVLRYGIAFQRSRETPPVPPIPRACFQQSYKLALKRSHQWIYCEGYALSPNVPTYTVHHAWVVRADAPTEAIDVAWAEGTRRNTAYFGIPFRREFVRDMHAASRRRLYGVLDTPWARFPLLTGQTRIDDVIWRPEN